jgi:hypothetical protein
MKRILFFIFYGLTITANAQEKETVYSIVEEIHDKAWYEIQLELWEKDAKEGSKSPNAWYNYYAASRALLNLTEGDERKKYKELGKTITEGVLEEHPDSFEANYVAMWSSGLSGKDKGYLWKAYEISPDDPRLYDELLIHYEIEMDAPKRTNMAEKMVHSNYLAAGVLNWGYNVLAEVEESGIILSVGDNDTYALWLNMYGMKYRTDVTVLNLHMLFLPDYREKYFTKLGIDPISTEGLSMNDMIAHVMKNDKGIPVHIATTAYHCVEDLTLDSNLYLTGLTYQYCEGSLDNNSLIRRNFEQRFTLDYLKVKFSCHQMDQIVLSFDATYLAAMVKLYKMYETAGEKGKMEDLAVLMENASEYSKMSEEIQKIIH